MSESNDINRKEELKKDRRYLFILSLIIIVNYLGQISIDSENLKILNNTVSITNPEVLYTLLILIWGYFLMKFRHSEKLFYKTREQFLFDYDYDLIKIISQKACNWCRDKYIREGKDVGFDYKDIDAISSHTLKPRFGIINIFFKEFMITVEDHTKVENYDTLVEYKIGFFPSIIIYLKSFYSYILDTRKFLYKGLPYFISALTFFVILIELYNYFSPIFTDQF